MRRSLLVIVSLATMLLPGCQMYPSPGSLLPSIVGSRQDRSIEAYAATSGFPSPQDVGLASDEESE